jgi:hypothetical protein
MGTWGKGKMRWAMLLLCVSTLTSEYKVGRVEDLSNKYSLRCLWKIIITVVYSCCSVAYLEPVLFYLWTRIAGSTNRNVFFGIPELGSQILDPTRIFKKVVGQKYLNFISIDSNLFLCTCFKKS